MARHSLFPNSITIHYTTNGHDHLMTLPTGVVAGSAPGWTLPVKSGSPVDWRTAVEDLATLLAPLIVTASSIDYAELFTYEATGSPAEFLAAHVIDQAGSNVGSPVPFVQAVFPFKAVGGNSLRFTLLESVKGANVHLPYTGITDGFEVIPDFILSDDNWIKTRGGEFPNVSLGLTSKVNDKLRKRYLLDS